MKEGQSGSVEQESLRIALVHDWFVNYSGAERVLEQILKIYPAADLFGVVDFLPESLRWFVQNRQIKTTFIQHLPFAATRYRSYLPLMPVAVEQHDLSGYDLVISSSHAVAKGVLTGADQPHVSYVHSPMRYAWDLQHQYLRESGLHRGMKSMLARHFLHKMRMWDLRTANGVDAFIANSKYIARRIRKVYRRTAEVIYPPVGVEDFSVRENKEQFYVTASRLVPYKRVDLIVEAFAAMPGRRLVVIGDGPDLQRIKLRATPNVELLGFQPTAELSEYMQRARAFVFAAEEDFGIAAVEAQACGTPVIAYGKGGALESVRGLSEPNPTGVFFGEQSVSSIIQAVERFEQRQNDFHPSACRQNAERFSRDVFRQRFEQEVKRCIKEFWH